MRAQIQTKWWTKRGSLAGLMAAALLWAIPGAGLAQEEEIAALGKAEYQQYCSLCHGPEGKGDGLVAKYLEVKPPDLTQLSKKNEGQYPFWRVYRVVDGREAIEVHGTHKIMIWGGAISGGGRKQPCN